MKKTLCTLALLCLSISLFAQWQRRAIEPESQRNWGDNTHKQKAQVCFAATAGFAAMGAAIHYNQVAFGTPRTQSMNQRSTLIMAGAGSACLLLGGYFKLRQRFAPRGKETHVIADEKGVGVSIDF